MTTNFKTYVITNPSQTSPSLTLGPTGLTGYDGFFYLIMGPGGNGGDVSSVYNYGGPSGYMSSGYVDLNHPYSVEYVTVDLNPSIGTEIYLTYNAAGPNIDPSLGNSPFTIKVDTGQIYLLNRADPLVQNNYISGFYAPANNFPIGNPQIFNQRGERIVNITQAEGAVTDDFGQGDNSSLYAGAGFYGGSLTPSGVTGPFGYGSGNWYNNPGLGTVGYAVITLVPSALINNSYFFTGGTGSIGPGTYIYSLLGGGGAGGPASSGSIFGPGGGGGSGDIRHGIITTTNNVNYEIGLGGYGGTNPSIPSISGGDTIISYDLINLSAIGGETPGIFEGGAGYFAGGFNGPSIFVQEGQSYANIPSNFTNNANGAGPVNTNYGQGGGSDPSGNSYGGGGGPYGGNWAANAFGYGCGGGGGGGNGTSGYAILKQLVENNFKYLKITSPTLFSPADFFDYTGVWGFMDAPDTSLVPLAPPGRSYFNTFHFLIKEDNVQEISITKDTQSYFTTTISFSQLNGKTQKFTMTGLQPSPYMVLFFYR